MVIFISSSLSPLFIISCVYIYIYIYIYNMYIHIYVPLRGEGYERMWSSQTSFSLLWYWKLLQFLHSLSLYLPIWETLSYIYIQTTHTLSLSLSLSLCVVALSSVVSFFLFRSFTFSLLLFAVSVFAITLWKMKDGSCTQYIKLKMEALGGLTYLSQIIAVFGLYEREEREAVAVLPLLPTFTSSFSISPYQ